MHAQIRNDDESSSENGQSDSISRQTLVVKAKAAEYRSPRHLNIDAVFVVDERQSLDLVDDETLKAIMKYGKLYEN